MNLRYILGVCGLALVVVAYILNQILPPTAQQAQPQAQQLPTPMSTPVGGVDTSALVILNYPDGSPSDYSKDRYNVYFQSNMILGADPSTFEVLQKFEQEGGADEYAKDKAHVFFFGFLIEGADRATFEVLPALKSCESTCRYEARDANHKYLQNRIVN
jgi:hypothetical protein